MARKLRKITKANITHISFVPKGANGQDFLIVKADGAALDLVHESPILKLDDDKHLVTGVVYAPDVVDSQGEFMEADAIEKAAHEFMASSRKMDERHNFVTNEGVSVVESYVAKADTRIDGEEIKKGTWLITAKVEDSKLWDAVKKGEYKGFSMGGTGAREEVSVEEGQGVKKEEQGLFAVLKEFFTGERSEPKEQGIEKAGKSFSASNAEKIKAAYLSLGQLIEQMEEKQTDIEEESEREGEEVKKEELQEIIKEALKPVEERIAALEKQEKDPQEKPGTVSKEELLEVVKESIEPVTERLEKLEKTRGISNQMIEDGILKEERAFSSVLI